MPRRRELAAERMLAQRSPWVYELVSRAFASTFRKHFHALRLSRSGTQPDPQTPHLVLYSNHPSWWDPVAFVLLGRLLFNNRSGFAPMEAGMVARYGFMKRIGAFGIDKARSRGASTFLSMCRKVLEAPERLLVVTAQGEFVDVRQRPVLLQPGLAHLVDLCPQAQFIPLALEYVFWDERQPEMLVRFGALQSAKLLHAMHRAERTAVLANELQICMDALAGEAVSRSHGCFRTLMWGRVGVGGVYDFSRRVRARLSGSPFSAAHGSEE